MPDYLALNDHLLQDREEIAAFCELLRKEGVRSYLEIGSWSGGSIEMVAKHLPKGSRIMSIEMPVDQQKFLQLQQVLSRLHRNGYWVSLWAGDSTSEKCIRKAMEMGPFDAIFIDGSHTYEGVESDWQNYGYLGRIVGFHDIAIDKPPHGVAKFWRTLKPHYRHVEFISEETRRQTEGYGIGVVWPDEPIENATTGGLNYACTE